jgi:hypothetical protein
VVTAAVQHVTIPHETIIREIHRAGVKYFMAILEGNSKMTYGLLVRSYPQDQNQAPSYLDMTHVQYVDLYVHEEDCYNQQVTVTLQVQSLHQRVTRLVVIERSRISQVGSVEVIEKVTRCSAPLRYHPIIQLT